MAYIYDVFISYKRGKINEQWLNEIFLPFFTDYLSDSLLRAPKIFVDRTGLTPGVNFEDELFNNLIYSKTMVAVMSPTYFFASNWCVKEFLTMRYKEEFYKLSSNTIPKTLLWPILYRKVKPMPTFAQNLSYLDYSDYNVVGEAFYSNQMSIKFQQQLQKDIDSISDIINNAPPINEEWDTSEGRNKVLEQVQLYYAKNSVPDSPKQDLITWETK